MYFAKDGINTQSWRWQNPHKDLLCRKRWWKKITNNESVMSTMGSPVCSFICEIKTILLHPKIVKMVISQVVLRTSWNETCFHKSVQKPIYLLYKCTYGYMFDRPQITKIQNGFWWFGGDQIKHINARSAMKTNEILQSHPLSFSIFFLTIILILFRCKFKFV